MADFDAAPGAAFALEALEVGALVYVAGRAYRLDRTRRFVRAAEADRLDADACGAGDADGAAAPDGPSLINVLDLSAWTPLRAPVPPPALPEGGHLAFSPAKKVRFAELLAESGNVRHACAVTGISRHTAYKARRRDGVLAQAWDAALALAAEHVDAVLAERALEGVEEPVFWKGELVGTRRRYDNRLLLAHASNLMDLMGYFPKEGTLVVFRPLGDPAGFEYIASIPAPTGVNCCVKVKNEAFSPSVVP